MRTEARGLLCVSAIVSLIAVVLLEPHSAIAQSTMKQAPKGPRCEWIPSTTQRPDGSRCGFNDIGLGNPAIFECGKAESNGRCVDRCFFKKCGAV